MKRALFWTSLKGAGAGSSMMADDGSTISAATAIIRDLARNVAPAYNPPEFNLPTKHARNGAITLPGPASDSKRMLELEMSALASRVKWLEEKASVVANNGLPDTPNEMVASSPFGLSNGVNSSPNGNPRLVRNHSSTNQRVNTILGNNLAHVSGEDFSYVKEHVDMQGEKIESQARELAAIGDKVTRYEEQLKAQMENVDEDDLRRELKKQSQANESFQKVLKEIGNIITNVASGNLDKKVQIHAREVDPEIAVFKKTINIMIDQLKEFGNEVSRVAREVGTEGILGGEAKVTGVSGIWADLTNNGKTPARFYSCA